MKPLTKSDLEIPTVGEAHLDLLAYKLLRLGARTKIVVGLTGMNEKRVRNLLRGISGGDLIPGPCPLPRPEFFIGGAKRNATANLHSTLFLAGYVHLETAFPEEPHPGYLLAAAFEAYCDTQSLLRSGAPLLDLNRSYALVRHYLARELSLVRCNACDASYIFMNAGLPDSQACPICKRTTHKQFLAELARFGGKCRQSRRAIGE